LGPVAEKARRAFVAHRFDSLLPSDGAVRLRLPTQQAGSPVRGEVAVASLEAFVRRHQEVAVTVVGAAVVGERQGYIELLRTFRPAGLPEEQSQRVLLSVRFAGGEWRVVEVWVVPGP
jgi:hypothetical protein